MITQQSSERGQCLILAPNRSADWSSNKRLIIAVTAVSVAIAGAFTYIGAWVIIPFAGLEILALSAALYWVSWHQCYRQVLWFEGSELRIEKGFYRPRDRWCWQRKQTTIHVSEPASSESPLSIHLAQGGLHIPVGEFLNAGDTQKLLQTLRDLGLRIRGYSAEGDLAA